MYIQVASLAMPSEGKNPKNHGFGGFLLKSASQVIETQITPRQNSKFNRRNSENLLHYIT
jgi:hypothetical protein